MLVEGISDRIVFASLLRQADGANRSIEVVAVNGKLMFEQYQKILRAFGVPCAVVADRDYLRQVGGEPVRRLFTLRKNRLAETITNPQYRDATTLVEALDRAISGTGAEAIAELRDLWSYIRDRHRLALSSSETEPLIREEIDRLRENGIFVLSAGALEAYLPSDASRKDDLGRLIARAEANTLLDGVADARRQELLSIRDALLDVWRWS